MTTVSRDNLTRSLSAVRQIRMRALQRRPIGAFAIQVVAAVFAALGVIVLSFGHTLGLDGPWAVGLSIAGILSLFALAAFHVAVFRLRAIVDELSARNDSEHEQILVRLGMGVAIFLYLGCFAAFGDYHLADPQIFYPIVVAILGFILAYLLLVNITLYPRESAVRRCIGIAQDSVSLSLFLYFGNELTAPWSAIYLWVTFGNGFRYGRRYLFLSALASVAGFACVVFATPVWAANPSLSVGLLVGLVVLPLYVSTLIKKLNDARAQAEEASRAKSRFLATMSHELRTPLNAVIGMSDMLREKSLDREQHEMASTIKSSARSLLLLINDILDFSKIEAGKITIEKVDFDLYELVGGVRNMLYPEAHRKDIRISFHVTPRTPHRLHGDARHMHEVLVNLTANAVKFTESGGVTIVVDAIEENYGATTLRVEVRDTGIGIPEEKIERIFESFTQADDSVGRRYGGTGLGLAISRQLVEAMGGRIGVDSTMGSGSRFYFVLPVDKQAPAAGEEAQRAEGNILVLSTEAAVAEQLAEAARGIGLSPTVALDPHEASADLGAAAPVTDGRTLILADEVSLGMEVPALAARIRARNPDRRFDLLLVSPKDGVDERAPDVIAETVALLRPPVKAARLLQAVRAARAGRLSDESVAGASADAVLNRSGRSLRVLVAEDNRTNSLVIGKILERAGHRVVMVEDGESALDTLEEQVFDIILMDVNMPGMSGIEAVKLFRFESLGLPHVPIIALTADATPETREQCSEAGMDGFLTKPVDSGELLALIDSLVPEEASGSAAAEGEDDAVPAAAPVANITTHPRFSIGTEAVVDAKALDNLRSLGAGSDFLSEVITEFLSDGEVVLRDMEAAQKSLNTKAFRDHAHALRSSSANMGAMRIFKLCMAVSGINRRELRRRGDAYMGQFRQEFERVRVELLKHVGRDRATLIS